MRLLFWLALAAAAVWALDRFGLWAEEKGWIYWRKKKGSGAGLGNALLELSTLTTNPSATHLVEARQARKAEERDSGDPPSEEQKT
jgi:hypothetical protein